MTDEKIDFIALTIGHADNLTDDALSRAIAHTILLNETMPPMTAMSIAIAGYDDDPRDIWEIQEACDYVLRYVQGITHRGMTLDRFLGDTLSLVQLCVASVRGEEITVVDGEFDIGGELSAYQKRVRRTMN